MTERSSRICLPKEPDSLEGAEAGVWKVWGASEEVPAVLGSSLPHRTVRSGGVALALRSRLLMGIPDEHSCSTHFKSQLLAADAP